MNFDEQWEAINALAEASLKKDMNGKWYVSQRVDIGGDGMLSGFTGRGVTPELAIAEHWRLLTGVEEGKYLVLNAASENRKHYRWNKFMWQELTRASNN